MRERIYRYFDQCGQRSARTCRFCWIFVLSYRISACFSARTYCCLAMSFYIQAKYRHFYSYCSVSPCNSLSSLLRFSQASSEIQAKKSCILLTSDLYMTTSFIYSSLARAISQVATFLPCSSLMFLYNLHFYLISSIFFSFLSNSFMYLISISCSLWMQICFFAFGAMIFGENQFSLLVDWNFLALLLDIFSLIWDRCIVNFIIFILIKLQLSISKKGGREG